MPRDANGNFTPVHNFTTEYNAGQKTIRADYMDEQFSDLATAITSDTTTGVRNSALVRRNAAGKIFGDILGNSTTATDLAAGSVLSIGKGGTNASNAGDALTNLGVSSFGKTLLDDADAATARATLGANIWRLGARVSITTTQTLGSTHLGKHLHTYSSPTLTLPPAADCENGSIILVSCYSGTTTIAKNGTDALYTTSSVSSFTLSAGEFAIISTNGTDWVAAISSLNAAVDLPVFNSLLAQLSAARASGAVPNGWCWLFKTDELATKTNATYDATGDYYSNGGVTSKVTITSDMLSESANIGDWNAAQLVDGNTSTVGFTAGAAGTSDYVRVTFATAKTISQVRIYVDGTTTAQWYVQYYNGSTWVSVATLSLSGGAGWKSITWTPSGSSTQWRIRPVATPGAGPNYTELEMYETSATTNMTLKNTALALSAEPSMATLYMLHKSVDSVTLNTDLKIRASLDNGSNWSSFGTLETVCAYDADYSLLKASIDVSALTGTSFVWEITTLNAKSQRVRAVAALFS